MTGSKPIILYHGDNCLDGFGAAYAAWKHFGDNAEYIPVYYGAEPPIDRLKGNKVFIVDFSYSPEQLKTIHKVTFYVNTIDHHKSFIEAVNAGTYNELLKFTNLFITTGDNESGAVLTWKYFHNEPVPDLLLHIQDRDLWKFKLNFTKEICEALACTELNPRTFEHWDYLAILFNRTYGTREKLISQGTTLLDQKESQIQQHLKHISKKSLWYGHKVIFCNAPRYHASELGNRIAEANPDCIAAIWYFDESNKSYNYSLRSAGDIDCTKLAKVFGGGGHKNASGFSINHKDEGLYEVANEIER